MNEPKEISRKSPILVTVTPYNERRVNGIVRRQNPGAPVPPPPPPRGITAQKSRPNPSDDAVEMQSIESFKLKEPQSVATPKPPSTYFPASRDEPGQENLTRRTESPTTVAGNPVGKKLQPGVATSTSAVVANGTTTSPVNTVVGKGKVAIRIGAYSGEAKPPAKLDFLGGQAPATTVTPAPPVAPVVKGVEVKDPAPVASRLQNELAATLQRSNLRKKTDGEIVATNPVSPTRGNSQVTENPVIVSQSNVERLAAVLGNKVTIKINTTENASRQD